jgi:tetratricopeptide (TPR) repeat protein
MALKLKQILLIIILIPAVLLLKSCDSNSSLSPSEISKTNISSLSNSEIDKIMHRDLVKVLDSAVILAKRNMRYQSQRLIDSIAAIAISMKDSNLLAKTYIAMYNIDRETGNLTMESRKLIDTAIAYHLEDSLLSRVYLLLESIYLQFHNYSKAYESHLKVIEYGEKHGQYYNMSISYNSIGNKYSQWKILDKAEDFYRTSLRYAQSCSDSNLIATSLNNIGDCLLHSNNLDSAAKYFIDATNINKTNSNYRKLSVNHSNLGDILFKRGNYDLAQKWFESGLQNALISNDPYCIVLAYNNLGKIDQSNKNWESGLKNYQLANDIANNNDIKYDQQFALKGLSDIYYQVNKKDIAFFYLKEYNKLSDSLAVEKTTNTLEFLKIKIEDEIFKEEQLRLIEEEKRTLANKLKFLFFTTLIVIIILISINIYNKQKGKLKNLSLVKRNLELEQTVLNNELVDFSLHISHRNDLLVEINSDLKTILHNPENNEILIRDLIFKINNTKQSREEFELIQSKIGNIGHKFFNTIKNMEPKLTKNEIQLCTLLRINLSTKEIASLNNVSVKAVKMSRYRLRKKLNIGPEIDLVDYFKKI